MGVFDEQDLAFRTDELLDFLKSASLKEGFDDKKVVALGYSNGANIAGSMLVNYPDDLAGAILFRPMQPFRTLPEFTSTSNVQLFLSSGAMDPTVDPESIRGYVEALKKGGFEVNDLKLPASHNLTQQDVDLARDWFKSPSNSLFLIWLSYIVL